MLLKHKRTIQKQRELLETWQQKLKKSDRWVEMWSWENLPERQRQKTGDKRWENQRNSPIGKISGSQES